jgi:hypothetical protein
LSADGSELKDGRWTDARASASVGHFEAKRVRSAAVSKVEMAISIKDPGAEEGVEQQVQFVHHCLALASTTMLGFLTRDPRTTVCGCLVWQVTEGNGSSGAQGQLLAGGAEASSQVSL